MPIVFICRLHHNFKGCMSDLIRLSINKMTINVILFENKAHFKKLDKKTVRYLDLPLERKDKVNYLGVGTF